MNDCGLIADPDFRDLVWNGTVSRKNAWHTLKRWCEQRLLYETVHLVDTQRVVCYTLGAHGRRLLEMAGITVTAPEKEDVAPRMRKSMIMGTKLMVQLWRDLGAIGGVGGLTWTHDPFRGEGARPDARMVVAYQHEPGAARSAHAMITPDIAHREWRMPAGYHRQWLIIEIDAVSESRAQLIARAEHWREAWPAYVRQVPPATTVRFVWVTTGTWRRAATIWEIWNAYAWLPIVITTMGRLYNAEDGRLHPGHPLRRSRDGQIHAVWRDELGRARSLVPGMLHEDRWIEPAMIRQRQTTAFRAACAEQDTREPLAQWCDGDLINLGSGPRTRRYGNTANQSPHTPDAWRQMWTETGDHVGKTTPEL